AASALPCPRPVVRASWDPDQSRCGKVDGVASDAAIAGGSVIGGFAIALGGRFTADGSAIESVSSRTTVLLAKRNSRITLPTVRITSGNFSGGITIRAMTQTTNNSARPTFRRQPFNPAAATIFVDTPRRVNDDAHCNRRRPPFHGPCCRPPPSRAPRADRGDDRDDRASEPRQSQAVSAARSHTRRDRAVSFQGLYRRG